ERRLGQVVVELVPVPNAGVRIAPRGLAPLVLHEASQLSHFEKRLLLLLAAQAGGVLGVQLEGDHLGLLLGGPSRASSSGPRARAGSRWASRARRTAPTGSSWPGPLRPACCRSPARAGGRARAPAWPPPRLPAC